MNNTKVILTPKNVLSTYNQTKVRYHIVTEPMYKEVSDYKSEESVIRHGLVTAQTPQVVTNDFLYKMSGFGDEAKEYLKELNKVFGKNEPALLYNYKNEEGKEIESYHRAITYPSETQKQKFLDKERNLNSILINEPHQYRHPNDLGNKIVYDFSNSIDFEHELRERELRLRGFKRSSLTEEDDFLSMTFCDDIDEEGTDFPCKEFGREFNYDLENRLKLAKYRDPETHPDLKDIDYINNISANICCK